MRVPLVLLCLGGLVSCRPQDVGVDDILGAANSARYGGSEEPVDSSVIDDVFGGDGKTSGGSYGNEEDVLHVSEVVDDSFDECSYYKDQGYKCVPYYTCEDGEIVTDGGGLIDIRSSFSAILDPGSSKCEGYLEVCCRHPEYSTNAPTTTTKKPTTPKPRLYEAKCGRRNLGGIGVRIQNDKYKGSTQFGEWPHMCAVLEVKSVAGSDELNLYACGASLIAPGIVLTGAHCVDRLKPENIKIRCGEWDTQQQIEPRPHQDRYVKNVRIHPLFDPRNLKNDFAVLYMNEDFILSPHIDTICLPNNLLGIYDYDQKDCFATGWGKDKFGKEGEYQVIMKQVQMDTVESGECERRLQGTRLGGSFELHKSFICAGGEKDKDTCKGDGGGPLVCPRKQPPGYGSEPEYVQAGIIAWGIDCGKDGIPGVYANVADGVCFIEWATTCETGIPGYFDIDGCQDWEHSEIAALRSKIAKYQKKLNTVSADGSGTTSSLRNLNRKIKKHQAFLDKFISTNQQCGGSDGGYGDGDDSDDIDISSLSRKGESEGTPYAGGNAPATSPVDESASSYANGGPEGVVDGDAYEGDGVIPGTSPVVDVDGGAYNGGDPGTSPVVDGDGGAYNGGDPGTSPVVDGDGGAYNGGGPDGVVDAPAPGDGY